MASTRSVTVLLLALIFVLLCLAPAFAEGNDCNDPRSGVRLHKRLGLHRHGDKGKHKHHGRPSDEPKHKHAKPCADDNVDVRGPHRGLKSIGDECREEPQHRGDRHDEHPVGHSAEPCDDTLQDRPKHHREHEKRADLSDPCDETRGVGSKKHTDKHSRPHDKQQHHLEGESHRDLGGRGQSEQPGRGEQRGPKRGLKSIEEKRRPGSVAPPAELRNEPVDANRVRSGQQKRDESNEPCEDGSSDQLDRKLAPSHVREEYRSAKRGLKSVAVDIALPQHVGLDPYSRHREYVPRGRRDEPCDDTESAGGKPQRTNAPSTEHNNPRPNRPFEQRGQQGGTSPRRNTVRGDSESRDRLRNKSRDERRP